MKIKLFLCILTMLVPMASGTIWAAPIVGSGEKVWVDFTCRLEDGRIVMTTSSEYATEEKQSGSELFIPLKRYEPFSIVAGQEPEKTPVKMLLERGFEGELVTQLSKTVVGMDEKKTKTVQMTALVPEALPDSERYLTMSRVWKRRLRRQIPKISFEKKVGTPPTPGLVFDYASDLKGVVESVGDDTVVIKQLIPEGGRTTTAFGEGVYHITGDDSFSISIGVKKGQLVRTAHMIGRISEVKDDVFIVDYGNPFGGETVTCDIRIRNIGNDPENASDDAEGN